jgi:hypothetical protein
MPADGICPRCDRLAVMRRNLILRAGWLSWCVASTIAIPCFYGQQTQVAAHVLDVKGDWRLEGTAGVSDGQGLIAGAKITAASNRPGDDLTIVRDEDMSRIHVVCDGSATNPCRVPVVVPGSAAPAQSQLKSIVQAAISVLLSKPPAISSHYALTLTRGEVTVQESEAVVALDPADGIVLPPAPEDMPTGLYTVSIAHAGEKPPATMQTLQLTSEGTWRSLPWNAPGLFEISVFNADGTQVADVMVLVALPAQYQAQREAFDAMKSRTALWTGTSARSDEHLFLRSFLLSGQTAVSKP